MALTKEQRDNLPAEMFAVPGKRMLPIHDDEHTKMAWKMLDHTQGLTDSERAEAKRRILRRAKELGIDTTGWHAHDGARLDMQKGGENDGGQIQAFHFEAMSLEVPDVKDHPNRAEFSGVLTRVGEPSDNPVGGANGKRVLIPKSVAEEAIGSLLGMGVDYTPSLSGHDAQKKIGIITAATVEGDAINIQGFLYCADFPAVVAEIRSRKAQLGFSYEAQASVADWKSNPVEVTRCVFTGAAILMKERAAYTSTSLEAAASGEIFDMDAKELQAAITAAVKESTDPLLKQIEELKASTSRIEASSVLHKVKPHSDKIRACADSLEADGMGGHERHGHVAHLRRMADKMDAEAVLGKIPHIYRDHDWLEAGADKGSQEQAEQIKTLTAEVEKLKGQLFATSAAPARQTEAGGAEKKPLAAGGNGVDLRQKDAERKANGANIRERLTQMVLDRASAAA